MRYTKTYCDLTIVKDDFQHGTEREFFPDVQHVSLSAHLLVFYDQHNTRHTYPIGDSVLRVECQLQDPEKL